MNSQERTSTAAFPSVAEQRAAEASQYAAFAGLNLAQIRRDLTELLSAIRSNALFEEYTKHDISHINSMLMQLEWLIPDGTKKIMTSADWLLIVLSAYFHDLGMLVTRDEYDYRESSSEFIRFRDAVMNSSDSTGRDYAARVASLQPHDMQVFLYQEYVRQNHADRIRNWIEGRVDPESGQRAVVGEVSRLLAGIEPVFCEDLAIVCQSHHLNDLDNVRKYRVSRPYGAHPQETANVQYTAVLLRTMDLLDITSNRAPSVAYRIINPRDPFSQTEWAKQSAVRSIRPKLTADTEGNLDESLPKNTIEVHAKYANANGFFGLTSYLSYVQDQLKLSNDWITVSTKRYGAKHQFPWRRIDTANIEAVGFLDKPFEFTLDQGKILELLTGHTLYNDTGVVIRELVQNSIDAVRLSHGPNASTQGSITLKWHQQARTLEVWDNGTGMTQEIIERNFLRVGASYYQEESFKKENPDFSPISRFGIGVLSAFMVADQVEVVTCHPDDESARKLELRSVHGKYLIRLLNKEMDDVARALAPHGTMVKLHIRASAEMGDIGKLTQNWVLIPGCKVEVISDNGERLSIGYNSVKTALEAFLQKRGLDVRAEDEKNAKYRVIYKEEENVSVAYAVSWSNYFREWEFLRSMHTGSDLRDGSAICLEGIKVQDGVPGFSKESQSTYERSSDILALANIVGNSAPRTNVARSAFEPSRAYSQALTSIYGLYAQHVSEEVNRLQIQRQRSLTWAVSEAPILLSPISNRYFADDPEALTEALRSVPTLLIEKDGNRVQISACELRDHDYFWTVDGALPEHVEYILGELPAAVSMTQLLGVLGSDQELPDGPLLCTRLRGDMLGDLVLDEWVIAHLRGNVERRRCETKWVKTGQGVVWSNSGISIRTREWTSLIESITDYPSYNSPRELVSIPISGVTAEGFSVEDSAVSIGGRNYLLPGTEWIKVIKNDSTDDKPFSERMPADAALEALGFLLALGTRRRLDLERVAMPILTDSSISELVDLPAFVELWKSVGWSVFDTRRWQRKNEYYS